MKLWGPRKVKNPIFVYNRSRIITIPIKFVWDLLGDTPKAAKLSLYPIYHYIHYIL